MKTFKTKRAMMMAAKRLEAALKERLKMFSEPANVEICKFMGSFVEIECYNKNSFILTLVEVNEMVEVANEYFKDYDSKNWFIKFDTIPILNSTDGNLFNIPSLVIVLVNDKNK